MIQVKHLEELERQCKAASTEALNRFEKLDQLSTTTDEQHDLHMKVIQREAELRYVCRVAEASARERGER